MQKKQLLRSKKEFDYVFKKGERSEGPYFKLKRVSSHLPYPRFAFVASRRVDKKASTRNGLRRQAREWVRKKGIGILNNSQDIIFFFKKEATSCSDQDFYAELEKQFKKIRG